MIFHCKSFFCSFGSNWNSLLLVEIIANYYSTLIHKNISQNGLNVKIALFRYNFEKNNKKQIRFLVLCAPTTAIYDYILCFGRTFPIGAMVTFFITWIEVRFAITVCILTVKANRQFYSSENKGNHGSSSTLLDSTK